MMKIMIMARCTVFLILCSLLGLFGGLLLTTFNSGAKSSETKVIIARPRFVQGVPLAYKEPLSEMDLIRYLKAIQIDCPQSVRIGNIGEGGWKVCTAEPYFPRKKCKVYSFGINYDFSFDDGMAAVFGCSVKCFDPSMQVMNHRRSPNIEFFAEGIGGKDSKNKKGWTMKTFKTFLQENRDNGDLIDYLKFDVESSEWDAIPNMAKTGVLRNVKQIGFELHRENQSATKIYNLINMLTHQGFRKWHARFNPTCSFYITKLGLKTPRCVEFGFINVRFLGNSTDSF